MPCFPLAGLKAVSLFTLFGNCECRASVVFFTTSSDLHSDFTKIISLHSRSIKAQESFMKSVPILPPASVGSEEPKKRNSGNLVHLT